MSHELSQDVVSQGETSTTSSLGFAAVPNWLVRDKTITAHEKLVYLVLSSKIGGTGAWFTGHAEIAEEAGISVSSVQRALTSLRERGVVTWSGRRHPETGARLGNSYRITVDRLGQADLPPRSEGPTPPVSVTEQNKNPEQEPRNTPPTPSSFDRAWSSWPRKEGKESARKAWAKALAIHLRSAANGEVTGAPVDASVWSPEALLIDTVSRFGAAYGRNVAPRFIPHLSSWLNQKRWTDPLPVDQSRGSRQPEPPQPKGFVIPFGHRMVRDEMGHIVGTEPI